MVQQMIEQRIQSFELRQNKLNQKFQDHLIEKMLEPNESENYDLRSYPMSNKRVSMTTDHKRLNHSEYDSKAPQNSFQNDEYS